MKSFKSGNWSYLRDNQMKSVVHYCLSDLDFERSGQMICDVETVVVILWHQQFRYVGVAQCGPRDEYKKEIGREIAAGRALKQLTLHLNNPERNPNDVWECEGQEIIIFGSMPQDVEDQIHDGMMFE